MNKLLIRIFSGTIYVLVFLTATFYKESYSILIILLGFLSIWEFSRIVNFKNISIYILFLFILFLIYKTHKNYVINSILCVTIMSSIFLSYFLFTKKEIPFSNNISKLGLIITYPIFSIIFIFLLPFYKENYTPNLTISVLAMIWVNDSFAFLTGKYLGSKKLFATVSPKKTIEGFLGGFVFTIAISYFISTVNSTFTPFHWIIISIITSVLGTIGDLIQSKFKRQVNIKDSGNIIPGHGGVLDRLDSLLFVAPFVYLYINYLI